MDSKHSEQANATCNKAITVAQCLQQAEGARSDLLHMALNVSKASAELLMLGFKQSHAMLQVLVSLQEHRLNVCAHLLEVCWGQGSYLCA